MGNIISIIKDFLEEFSEAYKYAELDFYKLKSEVLFLMDKAKEKGFDNPDYCEMTIKVVNKTQTKVSIQTYYKVNEKFRRFSKELDLGILVNIPAVVKNRLKENNEVKIRLTDFDNLYSVNEKDIIPTVEFEHLYHFTLKNAKGTPVRKELHIKDELFYYQVVLVYVYDNGEKNDCRVKNFGNIKNIPQEVISKITSTEEKACFIDVTNV